MSGPEPPTDVRLVAPDGTERPVEVGYVGTHGGMAVWANAHPLPAGLAPGWRMTIGVLPARTAIRLG